MVRYEEARVKPPWSSGYLYGVFGRAEWNGIWVPAAAAVPLSGDLGAVAALSEKCTALQLSPEQLMDGGGVASPPRVFFNMGRRLYLLPGGAVLYSHSS